MTVVITGAGSGIGRATARGFAARGDDLVLCDLDEAALTAVVDELGERVRFAAVVDVADANQMAQFAQDAQAACDPDGVRVLVNNAGVAHVGGALATSLAQWNRVIDVNVRGVVHGCHFFAPRMVKAGRGVIINVSSVLGFTPLADAVAYVASKYAVLGMSQSMHRELERHGVAVCAICPGLIATNIINAATWGGAAPGSRRGRLAALFARSGASPEVVARAIMRAADRPSPVVPVTKEAWLMWAHARLVPEQVTARVARWMESR